MTQSIRMLQQEIVLNLEAEKLNIERAVLTNVRCRTHVIVSYYVNGYVLDGSTVIKQSTGKHTTLLVRTGSGGGGYYR